MDIPKIQSQLKEVASQIQMLEEENERLKEENLRLKRLVDKLRQLNQSYHEKCSTHWVQKEKCHLCSEKFCPDCASTARDADFGMGIPSSFSGDCTKCEKPVCRFCSSYCKKCMDLYCEKCPCSHKVNL